uniref:Conserved plasma membrane protein n=1 Tax=Globodera pallida TaxID=36090 RepID=A0A183CH26_GLOPA
NLTSRQKPSAPPGLDEVVDPGDGWEKLKALVQKASPVVGLAVFGLLCWYTAPLLVSAGCALFENFTSLVMGLAALLRNYFPEIVASGIAFFSAFALSKKKLED